jgi:hypothetical protein
MYTDINHIQNWSGVINKWKWDQFQLL